MKNIFISYSKADTRYKNKLITHFSALVLQQEINIWDDGLILPGVEWDEDIKEHLRQADIVLLLLSSDAIASAYIQHVEIKMAMEGHNKGNKIVIPVILRTCDWKRLPIAKIQALPTRAKPIARWTDKDEAYYSVVKGIKNLL